MSRVLHARLRLLSGPRLHCQGVGPRGDAEVIGFPIEGGTSSSSPRGSAGSWSRVLQSRESGSGLCPVRRTSPFSKRGDTSDLFRNSSHPRVRGLSKLSNPRLITIAQTIARADLRVRVGRKSAVSTTNLDGLRNRRS